MTFIHFYPGALFDVFMWIIRSLTVVLAIGWLRRKARQA